MLNLWLTWKYPEWRLAEIMIPWGLEIRNTCGGPQRPRSEAFHQIAVDHLHDDSNIHSFMKSFHQDLLSCHRLIPSRSFCLCLKSGPDKTGITHVYGLLYLFLFCMTRHGSTVSRIHKRILITGNWQGNRHDYTSLGKCWKNATKIFFFATPVVAIYTQIYAHKNDIGNRGYYTTNTDKKTCRRN